MAEYMADYGWFGWILIVALVVLGGWKPFQQPEPAPVVARTAFVQVEAPDSVKP